MKKFKIAAILFTAVLNGYFLFAEPSFSGVFAGNTGISGTIPINEGASEFQIPLSTFAAAQVDLNENFTLRGELEIHATDFPPERIFEGNDAIVKLHELSLVFTKQAISLTHFISAFLGSYEAIGCDTFLMRQFGMEPISSPLTKSVTNIAGVPLYSNSGAGISYIARIDKKPISTGAYFYFLKNDDDKPELNIDFRIATNTTVVTLDFIAGLGIPVKDNGKEEDDNYVVAIKTLKFHTGLNMLLGNKYTHGLLLQAGFNNIVLGGNDFFDSDISFIVEPRIRFEKYGIYLTAYALNQESIEGLLYLNDPIGAGVTVFFDAIEAKNGIMTVGFHVIATMSGNGVNLANLLNSESKISFSDAELNAYISPYVELPLNPSAKLEFMGQVGVLDILDSMKINFKVVAGFRKQF